jgi:rhodanese-related sulfurtransferase
MEAAAASYPIAKTEIKLSRRGMLFKIARVATSKLVTGKYHFSNVSEISAAELHERISSNWPPMIIDTRSSQEFSSGFGHIPNSKLIPLMDLVGSFPSADQFKVSIKRFEAQIDEIRDFMDKEVVTICPGGGFSLVAAEIMAEAGFKYVKSLSGGVDGWFKKGFPTTRA